MLWCPVPHHADNLGSITHHPVNFGAITRHAKIHSLPRKSAKASEEEIALWGKGIKENLERGVNTTRRIQGAIKAIDLEKKEREAKEKRFSGNYSSKEKNSRKYLTTKGDRSWSFRIIGHNCNETLGCSLWLPWEEIQYSWLKKRIWTSRRHIIYIKMQMKYLLLL